MGSGWDVVACSTVRVLMGSCWLAINVCGQG